MLELDRVQNNKKNKLVAMCTYSDAKERVKVIMETINVHYRTRPVIVISDTIKPGDTEENNPLIKAVLESKKDYQLFDSFDELSYSKHKPHLDDN